MSTWRRHVPPWPADDEPRCRDCQHWRCSHGQDGGECFFRTGEWRPDERLHKPPGGWEYERLCPCRGYLDTIAT